MQLMQQLYIKEIKGILNSENNFIVIGSGYINSHGINAIEKIFLKTN